MEKALLDYGMLGIAVIAFGWFTRGVIKFAQVKFAEDEKENKEILKSYIEYLKKENKDSKELLLKCMNALENNTQAFIENKKLNTKIYNLLEIHLKQ